MSEWASKLMNAVLPDRTKGDFDQYLTEVSNDQAERMYFQKEIDMEYECRPTYEQLSLDRIIDEANRNMNALKSLENLITERITGFSAFAANITKYRNFAESFENNEGSLRVSIDSFCYFIDQELQQSKQQIFLGDLKRSLTEMRGDALRRIQEYQREIASVEQDLVNSEKKILKLKEKQEKSLTKGGDTFSDLESLVKGSRKSSSFSSKEKEQKNRDNDDNILRYEKEMSEEIRGLLRSISNRDQVLLASRKAFQKLDRECKRAIYYTLRKILDKEKDSFEIHKLAIDKLDKTLQKVDIENDLHLFIKQYQHEDNSLILNSHALSLLSDLIPHQITSSRSPSPSSSFSNTPNTPNNTNNVPSNTVPTHHNHSNTVLNNLPVSPSPGIAAAPKDSKRRSFRTSFTSSSKSRKDVVSPGETIHREHTASPNPPIVSPQPVSQMFVEEYNKHLSNIFFAVDEKKLTTTGVVLDDETEEEESSETNEHSIISNDDDTNSHHPHHRTRANTDDSAPSMPPPPVPSHNNSASSSPPQSHSSDRRIVTHDDADKDPYIQKFSIHRRFSMNAIDVKTLTKEEITYISSRPILHQSVEWLCNNVRTNRGREAFIAELNQFRSKKVDLQAGFNALVIVLWTALTYCQRQNDVRSAKVLMMLSQTFYRVRPESQPPPVSSMSLAKERSSRGSSKGGGEEDDEEDEEEEIARRGILYRQYIKEKILGHPLWEDGNYWEQALWQCAIEQLQTIPYEKPWYDMDRESRDLAVRRVHDVVFSQVMAITHSMVELGCSQHQTREFLYRMCVVHQLTESQRQHLLSHILRERNSVDR